MLCKTYLKARANEDTLLPTQMFPRLPARPTFVADTNFVSRTQKMFLILFRNILCPQQMFPSLRAQGNVMSKNVSETMCSRLPPPLRILKTPLLLYGESQKNWVGVCGPLYKTLTLSVTKISDFQYPIYDLTLDRYHVSDLPYCVRHRVENARILIIISWSITVISWDVGQW